MINIESPTKEYAFNSNFIIDNENGIKWSEESENILIEWGDISQCYQWLCLKSFEKYRLLHLLFTIPIISLSTLTGTASFAVTNNIDCATTATIVGSINILIGLLSTIQQYLKITELREQYKYNSILWGKLSRSIRIELAKPPSERMDCGHFIKISRNEFDKLMETTPYITSDIIRLFITTFQGKEGSLERQRFMKLKKPDMCNTVTITSLGESKRQWYDTYVDISGTVKLN